jgi:hypothetical protein
MMMLTSSIYIDIDLAGQLAPNLTIVAHTGQTPVSIRSLLTISPQKCVIAITQPPREHSTLASSYACAHAGILCQRAIAAGVNALSGDSGIESRG